jgi:hypothetical protein
MNFGFNSNVRVGDVMFHVQTEDRGPAHPFLDTVVYQAGRVVYKRSTSYEKSVRGTIEKTLAQMVQKRLAEQHREVIAELETGTLPFQAKEKAPPVEEDVDSQDDLNLRLTNPQSWFAAGNVVFEIELYSGNSRQRIGNADVQAFLERVRSRIPCAEARTDAEGRATLKFPMPAKVAEGSSLVVRATDGSRYGELRFRLKSKPRDKTPAPVSR